MEDVGRCKLSIGVFVLINDDADDGRIDKDGNKGGINQSPKGNM